MPKTKLPATERSDSAVMGAVAMIWLLLLMPSIALPAPVRPELAATGALAMIGAEGAKVVGALTATMVAPVTSPSTTSPWAVSTPCTEAAAWKLASAVTVNTWLLLLPNVVLAATSKGDCTATTLVLEMAMSPPLPEASVPRSCKDECSPVAEAVPAARFRAPASANFPVS